MTEEHSIGRPTVITDEIAEGIFQRIEAGESISAITKTEGFPSSRTLYRRVESDEEFRSRFNWSLMLRSELWAEQIVSISDSVKGSTSMEEINAAARCVAIDFREALADNPLESVNPQLGSGDLLCGSIFR